MSDPRQDPAQNPRDPNKQDDPAQKPKDPSVDSENFPRKDPPNQRDDSEEP